MVAQGTPPLHEPGELFMVLKRLTSQMVSERHSRLTSYQDRQAEG
jgi:hypothetical protein